MPNFDIPTAFRQAVLHQQNGRLRDAEQLYRQILAFQPNHPDALCHLGGLALEANQLDAAIQLTTRALSINPNYPLARAILANGFLRKGDLANAAKNFQEAVAMKSDFATALQGLAITYFNWGKFDQAVPVFRRALTLPGAPPHFPRMLAMAHHKQGEFDQAAAVLRTAIENSSAPNKNIPSASPAELALIHSLLGSILKDQALLDGALDHYRKAFTIDPSFANAHSNYLYALQFHPTFDQHAAFAEHQKFNADRCLHLAPQPPVWPNDPSPNRRLKIGYISTDFRAHALGYYLLSILSNHDKSNFEIICYADIYEEDEVTRRIKQAANQWINIRGATDEQLAQKIRQDNIDILIDLHLHMGGCRPLLFARKPAPVQIAYAGYPGTTGLTAIDYRLTDQYLEPENLPPIPSSEKVLRLPDTFWCYTPPCEIPVNSLPALTNGFITFGSLNNFCKVTHPALALWAKMMNRLPGSRLMLVTEPGSHRTATTHFMQSQGISEDRIIFVPNQTPAAYFEAYHQMDIGLNTFPYNGQTTSLDSFFMGVPVVTTIGQTPNSRAGLSQLTNLNLTELAAPTEESFIQTAVALANDLPRLSHLRATLRDRMKSSPLMNGPLFAKNIESAYRTAWTHWCASTSP